MENLNLSYKQLQEALKKANDELAILKSIVNKIQGIILEYKGISKDMPLIVLSKQEGAIVLGAKPP